MSSPLRCHSSPPHCHSSSLVLLSTLHECRSLLLCQSSVHFGPLLELHFAPLLNPSCVPSSSPPRCHPQLSFCSLPPHCHCHLALSWCFSHYDFRSHRRSSSPHRYAFHFSCISVCFHWFFIFIYLMFAFNVFGSVYLDPFVLSDSPLLTSPTIFLLCASCLHLSTRDMFLLSLKCCICMIGMLI